MAGSAGGAPSSALTRLHAASTSASQASTWVGVGVGVGYGVGLGLGLGLGVGLGVGVGFSVAGEHRRCEGRDRNTVATRAAHQLAHSLDGLDADPRVERRRQPGEPRAEPLDALEPRRAKLDAPPVARRR